MLTTTSEYALRAVGYLATADPDTRVGSEEIAQATHVPKRFLLKILHTLKNHGILTATRGIGGGFRLAVPPDSITFHDIITIFEDLSRYDHCPLGEEKCGEDGSCPMHEEWSKVRNSYKSFLKNTTFQSFRKTPSIYRKP